MLAEKSRVEEQSWAGAECGVRAGGAECGVRCAVRGATCLVRRARCEVQHSLKSNLDTVLTKLGVVKRPERERGDVRLHVSRQKGVQRVVGAHADPRLKLADLEAMLETEVQADVRRKTDAVPRADIVERSVHHRIGKPGAPVQDTYDQPSGAWHCAPAGEQSIGGIGSGRRIGIGVQYGSTNGVVEQRERVQVGQRLGSDIRHVQIGSRAAREMCSKLDFTVTRASGALEQEL